MTEITFHFNAPDTLAYTCRLLKTVVNRGLRVCVLADDESLSQIDRSLWRDPPTEFWAHCLANAQPQVLAASPIILGLANCPVLVNLGTQLPQGFERFERLNEIIGLDDASRLAGRQRWKHYAERGYAIKKHEVRAA